jgi:hypothetical protein
LTTCQQAGNKQCEPILLTSCWKSIASYKSAAGLLQLVRFYVCNQHASKSTNSSHGSSQIIISFSSIKFEFGIDNTVGGRITFAAAVDFTIFGKRLNLNVNINLRNPTAAVKETSSKAVDNYKVLSMSEYPNSP